jgi:hypothetical protein
VFGRTVPGPRRAAAWAAGSGVRRAAGYGWPRVLGRWETWLLPVNGDLCLGFRGAVEHFFPVGAKWPGAQLGDRESNDFLQEYVSGREMRASNVRPQSSFRGAGPEMQVRAGHMAVRMPMVGQDLTAIAILESVLIPGDGDAPGAAFAPGLDQPVAEPGGQAEPGPAEPDGVTAEDELAQRVSQATARAIDENGRRDARDGELKRIAERTNGFGGGSGCQRAEPVATLASAKSSRLQGGPQSSGRSPMASDRESDAGRGPPRGTASEARARPR